MKSLIYLRVILSLAFFLNMHSAFAQKNPFADEVPEKIEELAYKEAVRAANNPEEFHKGIKDISTLGEFGGITTDMAKFYWAVAAVEFTHCLTSNDSTGCSQYMQGLKDPVGHLGFVLFMKTNKMTLDLAQTIGRKRINPGMASYLGLAAGMMAQSVFQDLYYHPTVQELFKTYKLKDSAKIQEKRKELLNKLWVDFTQNSGKYLFNKIPDIMGLLGTAYVSHKTVEILGKVFFKSGRLVQFAFDKETAAAVIGFGRNLIRHRRLAQAGFKFVFRAGKLVRVNPVVAIGSYMVETVIFLVWAPIIEEQITKQWDQNNAIWKIRGAKSSLEDAMERGDSESDIENQAREIAKGFDQFRKSIMNKAEILKMRHLQAIQSIDVKYQQVLMYYEWLARGMDYKSDLWELNQEEFHQTGLVNEINESNDYAQSFFCGKNPLDAVERTFDVHGIPVPFSYSYDFKYDDNRTNYENMKLNEGFFNPTGIELAGFKVFHVDNICESDLNKMNGGSRPGSYDIVTCPLRSYPDRNEIEWGNTRVHAILCRIFLSQARAIVLRTGKLQGREIRDELAEALDVAGGKVLQKIYSQRDLMVMRFEKIVRQELMAALTGKDVEFRNDSLIFDGPVKTTTFLTGNIPLGALANYDYETELYNTYTRENPKYARVLNKVAQENFKKREAAQELLDYSKMDYSMRVRTTPFFKEIPKEDWQKIVHTYREYIVP